MLGTVWLLRTKMRSDPVQVSRPFARLSRQSFVGGSAATGRGRYLHPRPRCLRGIAPDLVIMPNNIPQRGAVGQGFFLVRAWGDIVLLDASDRFGLTARSGRPDEHRCSETDKPG